MAQSIQFYGLDQVIMGLKNRNCPTWGIFQGRQFLFKCESDSMDESEQLLTQIMESIEHSTAIYTIKFYEQEGTTKKPMKVKENTPCDGSFNFRTINEEELEQRKNTYVVGSHRNEQRMVDLENKFNTLMEKLDNGTEDEEPQTVQSAVIGLLSNPSQLMELINALSAGKNLLNNQPVQQQQYISGVSRAGQTTTMGAAGAADPAGKLSHEDNDARLIRLSHAIDELSAMDPLLVEHMEKFARIGKENTMQFTLILKTLEGM